MTDEDKVQMRCDMLNVIQDYLDVEDLSAHGSLCDYFYSESDKIVNSVSLWNQINKEN